MSFNTLLESIPEVPTLLVGRLYEGYAASPWKVRVFSIEQPSRSDRCVAPLQDDIPLAVDARIEPPGHYGGGLGFDDDGRTGNVHPG